MTNGRDITDKILDRLTSDLNSHIPGTTAYENLQAELSSQFSGTEDRVIRVGELLEFTWLYNSFGNRSTNHLIDLPMFISMAFYACNRSNYRRVFDIGANAGIHTIVLSKLGYEVTAFEPDPMHLEMLNKSIEVNRLENVEIVPKALGRESGRVTFVRVDDNTTSSHIKGMKDPYGPLTEFEVDVIAPGDLENRPDLIKIDAEGAEGEIIAAIPGEWWDGVDLLGEVHGDAASELVWQTIQDQSLNVFSQRLAWGRLTDRSQLPTHHTHGNIFMTRKDYMPWGPITD